MTAVSSLSSLSGDADTVNFWGRFQVAWVNTASAGEMEIFELVVAGVTRTVAPVPGSVLSTTV